MSKCHPDAARPKPFPVPRSQRSPRCPLSAASVQLNVFDEWVASAEKSIPDPKHTWTRPARLATDCSSVGTPEMACKWIDKHTEFCFACDTKCACQKRLEAVAPAAPLRTDIIQRVHTERGFTARTTDLTLFHIPTDYVDVYVAGFMCSPWSSMGVQEGLTADSASTFFGVSKSVVSMRPRVAMLET